MRNRGSRKVGEEQFKENLRLARQFWPGVIQKKQVEGLRALTANCLFSVAAGDLQFLDGHWYVTHAGLLGLARRRGVRGIQTRPLTELCDPGVNRWVFRAVVYKARGSKGFAGYGDADPSNVSPLVRGAEMRVAETRAVNRALRKAFGIGLCSVEEIGASLSAENQSRQGKSPSPQPVSGNGQPRLRDRLCQLIRQHNLDPTLVKRYAADFCATTELREASREMVEAFINNVAEWAVKDRAGLVCQLNSYADPEEVKR